MIKRVVSFALFQPLFILLGAIVFIGAGVAAYRNLPVEAFRRLNEERLDQGLPVYMNPRNTAAGLSGSTCK